MKVIRENTENEMAAELQAVKTARIDALAAIASEIQVRLAGETDHSSPANMHQTPLNPSLKRKRSDDEGESASTECSLGGGDIDISAPTVLPVRTPILDGMEVPTSKRARRIVSTVMHTATAITLGAVATWSALAFS
jgi:hypothetical protein